MPTQESVRNYVQRKVTFPLGYVVTTEAFPWTHYRRLTVDELGRRFLADSEFQALQLGRFFGTPDGQLIARAVVLTLPGMLPADFELVVSALVWAATEQQRGNRIATGVGFLLAGAGVAAAIYDANRAA